jgi:hypothetical protein
VQQVAKYGAMGCMNLSILCIYSHMYPLKVVFFCGGKATFTMPYVSYSKVDRDHQNTEPSYVKTVFDASYPVAEVTPQACTLASL